MSRWRTFVQWVVLYAIFTGGLLVTTALGVYLFLRIPRAGWAFPEPPTFWNTFPWVLFFEGFAVTFAGSARTIPDRTIIPVVYTILRRVRLFMKPPSARYDRLLFCTGLNLIVVAFYLMFAWNI